MSPRSDHLILFSKKALNEPSGNQTFFERNWSLGWANFLLQEAGSYNLASIEDFDFKDLASHRFIYLPSSIASSLEKKHDALFKSYVEGGGVLIGEGLVSNFLSFSPVSFSPEIKSLKKITRAENDFSSAKFLLPMPFQTTGWKAQSVSPEVKILLDMEGMPVLFKQSMGAGHLFFLGFNFGSLLVGLQQGIPVRGERRLEKLFGTQERVIEPEDLVLKAAYLDNSTPWADLFERFLFKLITADRPAPRWWYFPGTHTGCLINSHDEEAIGSDPRLESMWKEEISEGVKSTTFVISDQKLKQRWSGNGGLCARNGKGSEIALHWNRFQKPRLKLRRFRWGMHEEPLEGQIKALEKETKQTVRLNRTHYLALGEVYGAHFEFLGAQGIVLDSTYGPNQVGRGYLFGTGYPYYGMTWEGQLSGVLELPFVTQETWGGADLEFLKLLITESDENFHQVVAINFHPHYTVLQKKGKAMWLGGLRYAKERKQWMPTFGEFHNFFTGRRASQFWSRFEGNILEVFAISQHSYGTLSLPHKISSGRCLSSVEVDGIRKIPLKIINAWSEESLVPVPQGASQVRAIYGG